MIARDPAERVDVQEKPHQIAFLINDGQRPLVDHPLDGVGQRCSL